MVTKSLQEILASRPDLSPELRQLGENSDAEMYWKLLNQFPWETEANRLPDVPNQFELEDRLDDLKGMLFFSEVYGNERYVRYVEQLLQEDWGNTRIADHDWLLLFDILPEPGSIENYRTLLAILPELGEIPPPDFTNFMQFVYGMQGTLYDEVNELLELNLHLNWSDIQWAEFCCQTLRESAGIRRVVIRELKKPLKGEKALDRRIHVILEPFKDILSKKFPGMDSGEAVGSFGYLLSSQRNIKRLIYSNDRETLAKVQNLGIVVQPFLTLTNPELTYAAVDEIRRNPRLRNRIGCQVIADEIRRVAGVRLADVTIDDVSIYSDEIAMAFIKGITKDPKLQLQFTSLEEHVQDSVRALRDQNVTFEYASRNQEDLKLGDKCGDCTQKEGINYAWAEAWTADVLTQFLKLFYDGKFVGRFNVVLLEANQEPTLLIDAIEFIPQVRQHSEYGRKAKIACAAGLEKIKAIAQAMGVKHVLANPFSNSEEVPAYVELLGYSYDPERYTLSLLRTKPLHQVLNIQEQLPYTLQTREGDVELLVRSYERKYGARVLPDDVISALNVLYGTQELQQRTGKLIRIL